MEKKIRVRIAPSPTGDPHVGTAYIALFNRVFSWKEKGRFILRIEDTDRERSNRESEEAILESLDWLGLRWDEGPDVGGPVGPYRQSERLDIYLEHSMKLLRTGNAYRCFCTPERLAEVRKKQQARKLTTMYDRKCREMSPDIAEEKNLKGEPNVIRLKVPLEGETRVKDLLREELVFRNEGIDDQILIKSDGFPTYHLANVVDDHIMEISHVIRAEEWLSSLPKHVMIYRNFGWEPPVFIHMPLLRNPDRSKISKRKNPVSLKWYRKEGYLPEGMINFLALMGFSMPEDEEIFDLQKMGEAFSWDRVSLGGPVFDLGKLDWLNGIYIRRLTAKELQRRIVEGHFSAFAGKDDSLLASAVRLVQERMKKLSEFDTLSEFFFVEPDYETELLKTKKASLEESLKRLSMALEESKSIHPWDEKALEQSMRELSKREGWKTGEFFMALRVAVTGRTASTPLFETMAAIGKESILRRIAKGSEKITSFLEGKSD